MAAFAVKLDASALLGTQCPLDKDISVLIVSCRNLNTVRQGVKGKEYDQALVDEMTLALLYLVMGDRREGFGARAWKSFDWETMNRLHEKGLISDPKTKAKSVAVTEEGFKSAKEAFRKHFGKEGK